jgi:integrase
MILRALEAEKVSHFGPEQLAQLNLIDRKIAWAASNDHKQLPKLKRARDKIMSQHPEDYEHVFADEDVIKSNIEMQTLFTGQEQPVQDMPPQVISYTYGEGKIWDDRLANFANTQENESIGFQMERFLEEVKIKQEPSTHKQISTYLRSTLDNTGIWVKETNSNTVTGETVSKHFAWLNDKNYSTKVHNKYCSFFRRFVHWLYTEDKLKIEPKNLYSTNHLKEPPEHTIRIFDNVRPKFDVLPEKYKLWALLGLNCGFTNVDLGFVAWEHINTETWRLTFKRRKTKKKTSVPTVTYQLWPITIEYLKKLPHRKGLLFVSSTGTPFYESKYTDGKPSKKDLFAKHWQKIKPKPQIPLKYFRHIGATELKASEHFRDYRFLFLGHSSPLIADKNYSAEKHWEPFWRALDFIRMQLGF